MANTLVQFRTDEYSRQRAANICENLGLDLQTYLRICISRLIQENGIPFSMKLQDNHEQGAEAFAAASKIADAYGISDMSLDEINAEIDAARNDN